MTFVNEKNLPKIIIYVFMIIMSSMILMISYFYVKNSYANFEQDMETFITQYHNQQKINLKREVNTVFDVLKYNLITEDKDEEELKRDAIRLLNNISFQETKSNYFFVYEIVDFDGGDDFAILKVNPNRMDLINKYISTNYVDADGKKFREKFLNDIRSSGESYTQYAYKKLNSDEIKQKISYFKLFPEWNWVIAVGLYMDEVNDVIKQKRKVLEKEVKSQVMQNIVLFVMFLSIALLISIIVAKKIDDVLKDYQKQVRLNELNLEQRVKEELEKNREQEQLLIQKSKFIALGEMISNIAHQWRQPLSELSSILMNMKFKHSMKKLDDETMNQKTKEAEEVLEFMSRTIDDFRNFFKPVKEKEEFNLVDAVSTVKNIVSSTLKNSKIDIIIDVDESIKLNTYLNEFEQVILNIINNAKDHLIEKNIENPWIIINSIEKNGVISLTIEDNAGGIEIEPKTKVFEPYFTTKHDSDGTGIGLYMSKIIIDKNMKGKLKVRNTDNGAKFIIVLPK